MLAALDRILDGIEADASVCTVLVTGNGRAFSAGGDLKGYQTLQRDREAFTALRGRAAPGVRAAARRSGCRRWRWSTAWPWPVASS